MVRLRKGEILSIMIVWMPVLVSGLGIGTVASLFLCAGISFYLWLRVLKGLYSQANKNIIHSIPPSHFVEKVRWSMDLIGMEFEEETDIGFLGIMLCGRRVPRLEIKRGAMVTVLYNSSDILNYLWSSCAGTENEEKAKFLEPTKETVEYDKMLDKVGVSIQYVVYNLVHRKEDMMLMWGMQEPVVPLWQKLIVRVVFPLLKGFYLHVFPKEKLQGSLDRIEEALEDAEKRLTSSKYLLGDNLSRADIHFASNMAVLYVTPENWARKRFTSYAGIVEAGGLVELMPYGKQWRSKYPLATAHVQRLYNTIRM